MTEAQSLEAGLAVVVKRLLYTSPDLLHATSGGVIKLIVERHTGLLVGASMVGPRGGEVLGMLSLAVYARIPLEGCKL